MEKPDISALMRHVSLRQLQVFEALARHRSFTKAADELFLAQPSVSIQIKKLGDAVGIPLLEVVGKSVQLTDAGRALYEACREVFDVFARFDAQIADYKGLKQGSLRLAVVTTAKYFAPIMLGRFCEQYPGIDVSLKVTNRERLLERLAEHVDDFYIMGEPPDLPTAVFEPFTPNPLVVVAWPGHPLARARRIAVERLADEPLIMREPGSGTRLAIFRHLQQHHVAPRIRMELGSNEAIKQAVMGKLGISILSRHAIGADIKARRLCVLDVRGFPVAWDWHIGYSAQRKLSVLAAAFLVFAREHGRKIAGEVSG